ncbi:MAG: LamG-like jellyroll fold domain-containing protein, partial [Nanoarchaeota archaeon]
KGHPYFLIGKDSNGGRITNGSLDEVAIYNYAKSAAEIYNDYINSTYTAMIYKGAWGYWHLDGDAADSSGKGNTGTVSGATAKTAGGIIGGMYSFDGVDDYINLGAGYNVTTNVTFSIWAKSNPGAQFLFGKDKLSASQRSYSIDDRSDGSYNFQLIGVTIGADSTVSTPVVKRNNNTWHHIVGTYDGINAKVYFDGEQIASEAATGPVTATSADLTIGNRIDLDADFKGELDEFAIYNRTLTAAEVKQLYLRTWYDHSPQLFLLHPNNETDWNSSDSEAPTTVSGAVFQPGKYVDNMSAVSAGAGGNVSGYWRFDDVLAGGTTANDTSSNKNDGTISGAVFVNDSAGGTALDFDGVNDFVNVSHTASLDMTSFTIHAWVKTKKQGTGQQIMTKRTPASGNEGLEFAISSTNKLSILVDLPASQQIATSSTNIDNNTWFFVTATFNTTHAQAYVNGILEATSSGGSGGWATTDALLIGRER